MTLMPKSHAVALLLVDLSVIARYVTVDTTASRLPLRPGGIGGRLGGGVIRLILEKDQ